MIFYSILVLVTEVWMTGPVWQVRPGTQPGQKVVLKKKGKQVDMIYVKFETSFKSKVVILSRFFTIINSFVHLTGIKTKNSYSFGDQYVHFNVSMPT